MLRCLAALALACMCSPTFAVAQTKPFVGIVGGIATLSADARTLPTSLGLSASSYKPENGPVLNLVAGVHLRQYVSIQANYVWNSNTLTLSSTASGSNSFYEERRRSTQQAALAELLVYFRRVDDRLRPYLSVGTGVVHFSSTRRNEILLGGTPVLPPVHFDSTRPALRVAVGMDVALTHRLALRYSFGETIRHNDVSAQLSPPGKRNLANFENLFGFVIQF
jgi:opacity protein-like surface antigen